MTYRLIITLGIVSALLGGPIQPGYAQARQHGNFVPYSYVGLGGGTSTYIGDLAGYSQPLRTLTTLPRWNAGLSYNRQFTPRFGARASFTWVRITGDDYTYAKSNPVTFAAQYARNLHFRNDLKEFALIGTYDFIPGARIPRDRPKIAPYALFGLGLVAHNPKALTKLSGETLNRSEQQWVALQPLGTEGQGQPGYPKPYSLVTVSLPVGLGVRYALSEFVNLAAEIRLTPTFTDYLDDAGGPYANPADLPTPLAQEFAIRGEELYAARTGASRQAGIDQITNAGIDLASLRTRGGGGRLPLRDSYLLTNFQIQYIIPSKIKCPPVR